MYRLLSLVLITVALISVAAACDPPKKTDEIEVRVLAIMGTEGSDKVDPKLDEFAKQVRKKDPMLKGFRIERTTQKKLKLGETEKFALVDKEVIEVTVNKERNEEGRITLTIKPPKLDQITYACACNKYFSVATQYYVGKGKDREQLFIAVMASPCGPKK
jgi:hypothetical protein